MKILFVGSKTIGMDALTAVHSWIPDSIAAVLTLDDQSDTRSAFHRFRAFSRDSGTPVEVHRGNRALARIVDEVRPDLALVVGWYNLIPEPVLCRAPLGFIGIHNSLLPRYRGGAPLVWALINGEMEVGASVFTMTPGMDDGPIWAQERIEVGPDETIGEVGARLQARTLALLPNLLSRILSGDARPVDQASEGATYCAQRTPEDGLIDWSWSGERIHNFIRAQSDPYPGAFTRWGDQVVRVWRSERVPFPYDGRPGQVARCDSVGVTVTCGERSAVRLLEIDVGGGIRTPAGEIIRSIRHRLT